MNLQQIRKQVDSKLNDYRHIKRSYQEEDLLFETTREHLVHAEEAQKVLQTVAQSVQRSAHDRIAGVVTKCLQSIFDDKYEFKIEFEQKRGRTEAELFYMKDGIEIDPVDGDGGGVLDVSSVALRTVSIILNKPYLRRLIVLDEPFKMVSRNHAERLADMLTTISEEMKLQIILVSHESKLQIGKIIQL